MSRVDQAQLFAALGEPVRLHLLTKIRDGQSITQLASDLPITRQAVTRHLRVLEDADLIKAERVGRETRFHVRPGRLIEAKGWLDDVMRQWDSTLGRLKDFAENDGR